ncbi:MAG: transporter related [Chthoniobacteraceae bacterium]|nr:transporter related [Chthoniobacteraceae bacterium]
MQSVSNAVLSVRAVSKSFGSLKAVHDLTLTIDAGACVGLLGPNGAGKTTIISMITGLFPPDAGEIRIREHLVKSDVSPAKKLLGLVPQELALYDELSAWDNLRFFGALYDLAGEQLFAAMHTSLEFVGLADRASDKVRNYSGGMKRRLNLAASLLHDPEILLLDEPTVGVDPQSRNAIFDNIELLRKRGKTIIYTTHYMEEVERLCDRVIIMDHGEVVADNTLGGLKKEVEKQRQLLIEMERPVEENVLLSLCSLPGVVTAKATASRLSVVVDELEPATSAVLEYLARAGCKWIQIHSEEPTLESVFLKLTGNKLRDL